MPTDRSDPPVLMWFRRDLRLADNPALDAAVASGRPVLPVYITDDEDAGDWTPGGAQRWWLHGSLAALEKSLTSLGSRLVLRRGPAEAALEALIRETGAEAVYWNRRYEPWAIQRDEQIKSGLKQRGVEARSFNAALLREPWEVATKTGGPYKVFTPFWKALRTAGAPPAPLPAPERIPAPGAFPESDALASWGLLPTAPDWAGGLRDTWQPGETAALARLRDFADDTVFGYHDQRDLPGTAGTSRLSAHLAFGELGPRQIWHAVQASALARTGNPMPKGAEVYLSVVAGPEYT